MNQPSTRFHPLARLLHWLMAAAILSMLFIGAGMVASVTSRHVWLLNIHKPLGIAILLLAILRIGVRLRHPPPPLPADLPAWQRAAALGSHWLLYALMVAMPLIGWAMLSAGGYPVMLGGGLRLPSIMQANAGIFTWLRAAHGYLGDLFLLTILAHLSAAMMHALIRRDGVLASMLWGRSRGPDLS